MLAHLHGQLWNASAVASSLGISAPTARHHLDILTSTFVARQLQPFQVNVKKRLAKAPKVYVRDTGLLHEILRIPDLDALMGHPCAGPSWEGMVVEQTLSILPRDWGAFFYRTHAGAELDLLLVAPARRPIAVEIKLSISPKLTAGTSMSSPCTSARGRPSHREAWSRISKPLMHAGTDSGRTNPRS